MVLQLGNQPPIQNNEILNHFAQTWQMARDVRSYSEQENDNLFKAIVPRLMVAGLLTFGTPVVIQDAPIGYRPWLGAIGQAAALATLYRAHRKIKHRNENIVNLEGLQLATINGVEDAIRHQFEHPPQLNPDSLSIGLPYDSDIPVEDLATTLARETSSGTLIVAPSGCGKTKLLHRAMIAAYQHYKGDVDFMGVDCKGDEEGWLGLEDNPQRFCVMSDRGVAPGFAIIKRIEGLLDNLKPERPTIALIDEWNNGISSALKLDKATDKNDRQNYAAQMVLSGSSIVTKGRSKKVYGWMTTHTPNTEKIGMDSSTRQSVNLIILARLNKVGLITSVLKGKFDFVDDEEIRDSLMLQWKAYRATNPNLEIPIALTNIGGQWRLVKLPDYRSDLPRLFGSNSQSFGGAIDVQSFPVQSFNSYELPEEDDEWDEDLDEFEDDEDAIEVGVTTSIFNVNELAAIEMTDIDANILLTALSADKPLTVRELQRSRQLLTSTPADAIKARLVVYEQQGLAIVNTQGASVSLVLDDQYKDSVIWLLYRHHRNNGGGVTEFIEKLWKIKKIDSAFQQQQSKLFGIIEKHLHVWIPLIQSTNESIAKAVYLIWRRDDRMRWKDSDRNLSFNDLKRLLREYGWEDKA